MVYLATPTFLLGLIVTRQNHLSTFAQQRCLQSAEALVNDFLNVVNVVLKL